MMCLGNECAVRKFPPCVKGIPCCMCADGHMGGCNSYQPCPAEKGGEE